MTEQELKQRTKAFGLRAFKLIDALPSKLTANILANQLGRAASSVGANYRAACRGRSRKDFIAKLGIVEEEVDESAFWLEFVIDCQLLPKTKVEPLLKEAQELTAIVTASIKSARNNSNPKFKI